MSALRDGPGPLPVTAAQAQRRADRGAKRMDRKRPGWWRAMDEDALDMKDEHACVLGQVYDDFDAGVRALHPFMYAPDRAAVREGFNLANGEWCGENWAMLRCAWLNCIAARREGARDA